MNSNQAAQALWGDYMGGEPGSPILAVGIGVAADGTPVLNVWVRGHGPKIPNPWQGFPVTIHSDTSIHIPSGVFGSP